MCTHFGTVVEGAKEEFSLGHGELHICNPSGGEKPKIELNCTAKALVLVLVVADLHQLY